MPTPRQTGISGLAVTIGGLGLWLVYSGIKDINPITGLGTLLRGDTPPSRSPGDPYAGPGGTGTTPAATGGTDVDTAGPVGPEQTTSVHGVRVNKTIATSVDRLFKDAAKAGFTGVTGGGYRSRAEQAAARMRNGCPDLTSPSSTCRVPTAPVGKSMHEKGLAIDFSNNGKLLTKKDPFFGWLEAHAASYGLKNLPSEAWHWSTNGT